jgi:hypothetical protein
MMFWTRGKIVIVCRLLELLASHLLLIDSWESGVLRICKR